MAENTNIQIDGNKNVTGNQNINGNQNIVGDSNTFTIYNQTQNDSIIWSEPDLTRFSTDYFVEPPFIKAMMQQLNTQDFLIIGGHPSINKNALTRHLAWQMTQLDSARDWQIKELESYDRQSLDQALRKLNEPTICILPQLSPQHVNYNPHQLQKIAADGEHLVIASSQVSKEDWKLQDSPQKDLFWHEISLQDYTVDYLTESLRLNLRDEKNILPKELRNRDWKNRNELIDGILLSDVAQKLRTPDNTGIFVNSLSLQESVDEESINQLISKIQNSEAGLNEWYYQLTPRKQLLVVALSFFDGLFDDQIFASLDTITENSWRKKDPLFPSYDYYDLSEIQSIFNLVKTENEGIKIESRSPEYRQTIIKMAWDSHRRYILATLPHIATIAQHSVNSRSSNMELYATAHKRRQLRSVISKTLSDVWAISYEPIQPILLQLAADNNPDIQLVAAEAMARLREYKRDEDLFNKLENWLTESHLQELIEKILEQNDNQEHKGLSYIRATIALVVMFAAGYDKPGELSPKLRRLFENLSKDTNTFVKARFANFTLPSMAEQHWEQLIPIMRNMVLDAEFIHPIAISLARAYRFSSEGILDLLDSWQSECQQLKIQNSHKTPRWREGLLATVVLTYGHIPYDSKIGSLTSEKAFQKLETILANEHEHPFVRIAVVQAITIKANERFDEIEPYLFKLVKSLQSAEREQIVEIVANTFLSQRKEQEGGQRSIKIDNVSYSIWLNDDRPLTEVESAMYNWVNQAKNKNAQQIGLQAFISFAELIGKREKAEIKRIKEAQKNKNKRKKKEEEEDDNKAEVMKKMQSAGAEVASALGIQEKIALWYYTLGQEETPRQIIQGLMPEAIKQNQNNEESYKHVINEWKTKAGNEQTKKTFSLLGQIVSMVSGNTIGYLISALVIGGGLLICNLLG